MKLLSVTVPCYNSQDYMRHCVETLLPGGDEVEILIVDDGSKDGTAAIADQLQAQYPTIVRAIHQENAGHGGAVMKGLENATGLYFKVVDSDDWVDTQVLKDLLALLRRFAQQGEGVDMVVSDFVYDKVGARHKKVMRYPFAIPQNKVLRWEEVGSFPKGHYLLMHSVIYRTQLLRESGLDLPRHTFYVDNLFVYVPMAQVKTLYYVDKVFYHYFIGREDQSVQEGVMIRRIDQQLRGQPADAAPQVDLETRWRTSGCAGICSTTWKSSPPSPRCCCSAPGTRSTWKRPAPFGGTWPGITPATTSCSAGGCLAGC